MAEQGYGSNRKQVLSDENKFIETVSTFGDAGFEAKKSDIVEDLNDNLTAEGYFQWKSAQKTCKDKGLMSRGWLFNRRKPEIVAGARFIDGVVNDLDAKLEGRSKLSWPLKLLPKTAQRRLGLSLPPRYLSKYSELLKTKNKAEKITLSSLSEKTDVQQLVAVARGIIKKIENSSASVYKNSLDQSFKEATIKSVRNAMDSTTADVQKILSERLKETPFSFAKLFYQARVFFGFRPSLSKQLGTLVRLQPNISKEVPPTRREILVDIEDRGPTYEEVILPPTVEGIIKEPSSIPESELIQPPNAEGVIKEASSIPESERISPPRPEGAIEGVIKEPSSISEYDLVAPPRPEVAIGGIIKEPSTVIGEKEEKVAVVKEKQEKKAEVAVAPPPVPPRREDLEKLSEPVSKEVKVEVVVEQKPVKQPVPLVEEPKKDEELERAEEARKADEVKKAEEARNADEARKAEEAKRAEEERRAEEVKRVEEVMKKAVEEAKKPVEEARKEAIKSVEQAIEAGSRAKYMAEKAAGRLKQPGFVAIEELRKAKEEAEKEKYSAEKRTNWGKPADREIAAEIAKKSAADAMLAGEKLKKLEKENRPEEEKVAEEVKAAEGLLERANELAATAEEALAKLEMETRKATEILEKKQKEEWGRLTNKPKEVEAGEEGALEEEKAEQVFDNIEEGEGFAPPPPPPPMAPSAPPPPTVSAFPSPVSKGGGLADMLLKKKLKKVDEPSESEKVEVPPKGIMDVLAEKLAKRRAVMGGKEPTEKEGKEFLPRISQESPSKRAAKVVQDAKSTMESTQKLIKSVQTEQDEFLSALSVFSKPPTMGEELAPSPEQQVGEEFGEGAPPPPPPVPPMAPPPPPPPGIVQGASKPMPKNRAGLMDEIRAGHELKKSPESSPPASPKSEQPSLVIKLQDLMDKKLKTVDKVGGKGASKVESSVNILAKLKQTPGPGVKPGIKKEEGKKQVGAEKKNQYTPEEKEQVNPNVPTLVR